MSEYFQNGGSETTIKLTHGDMALSYQYCYYVAITIDSIFLINHAISIRHNIPK